MDLEDVFDCFALFVNHTIFEPIALLNRVEIKSEVRSEQLEVK